MSESKVVSLLNYNAQPLKPCTLSHNSALPCDPGGIWKAVHSSVEMGGNCFALFLGSQRSWKRRALDQEAAQKFREQCLLHGFETAHILPHGSYLMNCGSPKEGLLKH